jgi:hypothetical protein
MRRAAQQESIAACSFDEFVAQVEADTAALRAAGARDDALLAQYQDMSGLVSLLDFALPALDASSVASILCGAASGREEDVLSWLAADPLPSLASGAACDDEELLALCTAFGLLA